MKKIIFVTLWLISFSINAQEKKFGKIFGGFESNSQWYLNDKDQGLVQPEDPIRSNNYLFLNYNLNKWSAGIQVESYEKNALLNYNPKYKGTDVATYFVNYKDKTFDFTAGYFYEQFGSGLIFRTWEDRALGINNAIRGARVVVHPTNYLSFTALAGQQRTGFDVSDAYIHGFNTEVDFGTLLKFETSQLSGGLSFVGRDEKTTVVNPDFDNMTNAVSYRLNFSHKSFYVSSELDTKSRDGVLSNNLDLSTKLVKTGNAFLLNMGYTKKRFGVDATFRRMQNMAFYSERVPEISPSGNSLLFNDKLMNFTPALTKQQHYNLANIYAYQAQSKVDFSNQEVMKAGEIGGQIDVFYDAKKGSILGGKYGSKFSFNSSRWFNLKGDYILSPSNYETKYLGSSDKYYTDYNFEVTKRFSPKIISGISFINQFYNAKFLAGDPFEIKANIIGAETTYNSTKKRSIRAVAEHMWSDDIKRKNWVGGTLEFNANSKMSFYVSDLYNYGNINNERKIHYYNLGGSYRKGSSRIALNYGRQRGGLVCVGGVCRIVPESTGVSLSLNTSF